MVTMFLVVTMVNIVNKYVVLFLKNILSFTYLYTWFTGLDFNMSMTGGGQEWQTFNSTAAFTATQGTR